MRSIPAARFKARCLEIMDEVKSRRETVLITKKNGPHTMARNPLVFSRK